MATDTTPRTPGRARPGRPDRTGPRHGADQMSPRHAARPGPTYPVTPRTRPFGTPRHARPITGPGTSPAAPPARPATRPGTRPATGRPRPSRPRAPFILLLVGLLGGALVSLLVISTTLAEGSYRIASLQQQNASLAKQEQLLAQQVAQASSPTQIAQEAEQFGMRPDPVLQFINLKTGKVVTGKVSRADAEINVPGYTP
jgi:hypothetical protein